MSDIAFIGVPTFRIDDVDRAKAFYLDRLGFRLDWEHYYAPGAPVYCQVSRDGLILHLTENERFPRRTLAFVQSEGLEEFHREVLSRAASGEVPEIESTPWNTLQLELEDPFGNLLRFNEPKSNE